LYWSFIRANYRTRSNRDKRQADFCQKRKSECARSLVLSVILTTLPTTLAVDPTRIHAQILCLTLYAMRQKVIVILLSKRLLVVCWWNCHQGLISPIFYSKLLLIKIPRAQKRLTAWLYCYAFEIYMHKSYL